MKDYIKINKAIDKKRVLLEKKNMEQMQSLGLYPKKFNYPVTLQFELTGACNLACKHCYNRSGDKDRNATTYMIPEKWKELAMQIVKDGGIFQCIISGGEPLLLGEDLFDIMDILHDDGTSFVVITNGFLLTKKKVKRFAKYRYFWFQISIDGSTEHLHDDFRGVKGSWKRAVEGALEISNAGIPLVIAHSVTPKTLPYLEDMVQLACNLGANSIILGEVLPSGRAISHEEIILDHEQRNLFYAEVNRLANAYRGKITIERSMNVNMSMSRYVNSVNSGGIIRPNGDFRLDCMAPFIMGNVLEESLKDIWINKGIDAWHSAKVQEFIASINSDLQKGNVQNHVDQDIRI